MQDGTTQTQPTTAAQILDASAPRTTPDAPTSKPEASKTQPEAQKADEKVSPKLQLLIQRERAAIERERAAKAKDSEIATKAQQLAEREARIQEFESLKKTNPAKALELLGLSYQELTQIMLADGNVTPEVEVRKLKDEVSSIKQAQEEKERRAAEDAKASEARKNEETITAFRGEISKYLKDNGSRYELIAFEGSEDLVYDVVDEHFERTRQEKARQLEEEGKDASEASGEVITIAQAADKVEAYLEKKYDKARELSKVKVLLGARQEKKADKPIPTPPSQKPKTLNNTLSATPQSIRKSPLTDDERVAKAIAYARGLRP